MGIFTGIATGVLSVTGALSYIAGFAKRGSLTFSGSLNRSLELLSGQKPIGSISFSGSISQRILNKYPLLESALTFAGSAWRGERLVTLQGILSFAGRLRRRVPLSGEVYRLIEVTKSITSTISFSGALEYVEAAVSGGSVSGAISFAGNYIRDILHPVSKEGSLLLSSIITKLNNLSRTQSSSLNSSGTIKRTALVSHLYQGVLSFAGTVSKGAYKTYSGVLDIIGQVTTITIRKITHIANVVSFSGSILRNIVIAKTKSGILTLSGLTAGIKSSGITSHWVNVSGSITPSGVIEGVRNLVTILVQGTLLPIGRLTLIDAALDRISAAALAPSGSILRRIITARTILTSALTVSGIASRLGQFKRPTMAGVLSFAGAVTNATTGGIWNYTTTGIASFAEALSKLYQALRTYAGALSLAGAVSRSKDMGRTITGALTFAGQSLGIFTDRDWNLGFLFPTGNVTPYLNTNRAVYASTLTTTGIVTVSLRVMARTLSGTLTPVSSELARYRDILYYGPPNP